MPLISPLMPVPQTSVLLTQIEVQRPVRTALRQMMLPNSKILHVRNFLRDGRIQCITTSSCLPAHTQTMRYITHNQPMMSLHENFNPRGPFSIYHLIPTVFAVFLPARRRPQGLVVIGVCLSVCLCTLFLSTRYLKNGFMDHHQIWWVGAGGEPLEEVQFWC